MCWGSECFETIFISILAGSHPREGHMIYTPLTIKAARIAYEAHHGQFDLCGMPYVFHPYHVAEQMTDEYTTCVALLHDVVEDTDVTFEDLEGEFPEEVIEALRLMTHEEGVDYYDYVRAIKGNPIAKAVKMADVAHTSDETRNAMSDASDEKRARWREKYARAREILES